MGDQNGPAFREAQTGSRSVEHGFSSNASSGCLDQGKLMHARLADGTGSRKKTAPNAAPVNLHILRQPERQYKPNNPKYAAVGQALPPR